MRASDYTGTGQLSFFSQVVRVSVALMLLGGVVAACTEKKPETELRVKLGQPFPSLSAQDLEGNKRQLRFDQGKVTVLNIWATWCGPCRHEMPSLQRLADTLDKQRFQVIGVSVDADDHVMREFLIDKQIRFANYQDAEMKMANDRLGIRVFPTTFVIDAKGKLVDIEEAWRYWDEPDVIEHVSRVQ